MTVSSTTARVSYSGNGSTTAFTVPFYFLANSHLKVVRRNAAGVDTTLVLNTDYTVTGAGVASGGTVTTTVAPATTETLTVSRSVPLTQEVDYQPNDPFPAESHEQALDKLTMIAQQQNDAVTRVLFFPDTDSPSISGLLPTSTQRAGRYLAFDGNGNPTTQGVLPDQIYLGAKNSDPTTRNDGTPLQAGDLYFNGISAAMRVYTGSIWTDVAAGVSLPYQTFSGNGATTAFTLSGTPGSLGSLEVFVSGVRQIPGTTYTISGTTLTFAVAPATGTNNIFVRWITTQGVAVPSDQSVTPAKLSLGGPTWSTLGYLGVNTASPQREFHVTSSALTGATMRFENSNTSMSAGDNYGTLEWFGNDNSTLSNGVRARMYGRSSGTTGGIEIRFGIAPSGSTTLTDRLSVTSSGISVTGTATASFVSAGSVGTTDFTAGGLVTLGQNSNRRMFGAGLTMTSADAQVDVDLTSYFPQDITKFSILRVSATVNYIDNTTTPTFAGSARMFKEWVQSINWTGTTYAINGASLIGTGFTSDATNLPIGAVNASKALVVVSATQVLLRLQNRTTPAGTSSTAYAYHWDILQI